MIVVNFVEADVMLRCFSLDGDTLYLYIYYKCLMLYSESQMEWKNAYV